MEDIDYELLYILCFSNVKIQYRKHFFYKLHCMSCCSYHPHFSQPSCTSIYKMNCLVFKIVTCYYQFYFYGAFPEIQMVKLDDRNGMLIFG